MNKKDYDAELKHISSSNIYLNIDYLENGTYILKITQNNKIIKTIKFKKS